MLHFKKLELKVVFTFDTILEAMKVRNLLKDNKYKVESVKVNSCGYSDRREKRIKHLLEKITEKQELSVYRLYRSIHTRTSISPLTFQRDLAILILRGQVEMDSKKIVRIKNASKQTP